MTRRSFLAALAYAAAACAGGCRAVGLHIGKIRLGLVGVTKDEFAAVYPNVDTTSVELVVLPDEPGEIAADAKALGVEAAYVSLPLASRGAAAIAALKAGLHVYVEAPPVRTLWELDLFNRTARASGVVTQIADVESSRSGFRRAVEIVSSGAMGLAEEACAWYGGVTLEDALPQMNLPFRAIELGHAKAVQHNDDGTLSLAYPARMSKVSKRTALPPALFTLCPGGATPPEHVLKAYADHGVKRPQAGWFVKCTGGIAFAGVDGPLFAPGGGRAVPADEFPDAERIPVSIPRREAPYGASDAHLDEFIDAVWGRGPKFAETGSHAYSDLAHSVPLVESVLVASVAQRILHQGDAMKWDSAIMHFDRADANALIRPKNWKSFIR